MRKIVTLIGSVVLVGLLSGCGNDYKCDSKDYAEQALNILFFGNAEGKNDKKYIKCVDKRKPRCYLIIRKMLALESIEC